MKRGGKRGSTIFKAPTPLDDEEEQRKPWPVLKKYKEKICGKKRVVTVYAPAYVAETLNPYSAKPKPKRNSDYPN